MGKEKRMSLKFRVKFEQLGKLNEEFSLVKVWVCAHGKNRNLSYISKDEINNALPTLAYCPVVAHLFKKEDGSYSIGGHDAELVIDENGVDIKDLTVPFGVVVADSYGYETVVEYGQEVEYLTAHAYLWTGRYPDLEKTIYSEDCWFNQSMEINFENSRPYADDSNYTEILGMSFSALCLLQKSDNADENVEPCFISARVEPVKFSFDDEFTKAFSEMKNNLSFCLSNKETGKGGSYKLNQDKINEILAEFELALEDLDFEISDDMDEDTLRGKLDDFKKRKKCEADSTDEGATDQSSIDSVNEENKTLTSALELAKATLSSLQTEFEAYRTTHSTENSEVEELRTFKKNTLDAAREADELELFSKFDEKLNGDEEYEALKADCKGLTLDEISDKCFALFGKKTATFTIAKPRASSVKLPVTTNDGENTSPYGDVYEKYLK